MLSMKSHFPLLKFLVSCYQALGSVCPELCRAGWLGEELSPRTLLPGLDLFGS